MRAFLFEPAMTSFSTTVDDAAVLVALHRLRSRTDNLAPLLTAFGEDLVASTKQRFHTATAPDGTPWKANSEVTISRYLGLSKSNFNKDGSLSKKGEARASGKKPLTGETGALGQQIHYRVQGNVLEVGSTMEYAAMQQLGGKRADFPNLWGDIPARPFLGLSKDDISGFSHTVSDYLEL
jgi:phage virion morphogenesis protein